MIRRIQKRIKQGGFIVTMELLLLSAILVLGLIVGMVSLRDSMLAELSDLSESIGSLNQSYNILGVNNTAGTAATAGSYWQDTFDHGPAGLIDVNGTVPGDSSAEYQWPAASTWEATPAQLQ